METLLDLVDREAEVIVGKFFAGESDDEEVFLKSYDDEGGSFGLNHEPTCGLDPYAMRALESARDFCFKQDDESKSEESYDFDDSLESPIFENEYGFKEIFRLRDMIDAYNAEHTDKIHYTFRGNEFLLQPGYHIWCYDGAERASDTWYISVIQNSASYGREEDLLEIKGLLTEEELEHDLVVGWLSADNVFERILKHKKGGE